MIAFPSLSLVGRLGSFVYYLRHGQMISRPFYVPTQPGTPSQLQRWQVFRDGVSAWRLLSPEEKATWNQRGARRNYEGFNAFMSAYLKSH